MLKIDPTIERYSVLENPAIPINSPEAYAIFSLPTASGIPCTYRALMGLPAIRKGVSLIAGHVAKLPLYVYRTAGDGSRKKDFNHPAYKLLAQHPSDLYTSFVFRRQMICYLLIYGNAYAFIDRDEDGTPTELLILDPENTVVRMSKQNEPVYHTRLINQGSITNWEIPAADVFHIKDFGDAVVGDGLLHIAKDSLSLSLALMRHSAAYFRNDASGEKFVILPPILKDIEKRKQFIEEYKRNYAGADHAGKTKWLPPGTEIKEVGYNPDQSQLIQSREFDLIQVADLLNIPAHKLGANIATSYSSLQSENQAFLDDCLDFWLVMFAQEAECKLLRENEKQNSLRTIDFDRSELLRMDPASETKCRLDKMNNGGISWEEYRLLEDLPPEKDMEQEWRHTSTVVIEGEPVEIPEDTPLATQQEDPTQPEKLPPEKDKEKTPTEDTPDTPDVARTFSQQITERLITRYVKSGKLEREIWLDHLGACPNPAGAYTQLETEWQNILPEQRAEIDTNKLVEVLWKIAS
jgi:HK97 family phage portal protein